jgi:hypothetical protein
MAQYPIDRDDSDNIADAVNTLLSGPSGLGQNFSGFSAYTTAYLTGNYRAPYTRESLVNLHVAPIALGTCEMLDGRTWKYNFAYIQASPPFDVGAPVDVYGVDNDYYNSGSSGFLQIGVVQCTTEYVICRTSDTYPLAAPSSGGFVELYVEDYVMSTDANAKVNVTSATDRVFISAQLDQIVNYTTLGLDDLFVDVQIQRYYGFYNPDPTNPDYKFNSDKIIAKKTYSFLNVDGDGATPVIETVFATIIDKPTPGYYWYMLEVKIYNSNGLLYVTSDEVRLRDLAAQVVKQ